MAQLEKTDLVYLVGGAVIVYLLFFKDKTKVSITAEPKAPSEGGASPISESGNPYAGLSDAQLFGSSMLPRSMPVIPSTPVASLVRTSPSSTTPVAKAPTPTSTARAQVS
jgi:hypothetical protein